jgi:ketosteroid isomerase-like protein
MSAEPAIRKVIATIEAAWRHKEFGGLEACFHEDVVIVGPGYVEYGRGRDTCAQSYREFATNAEILDYSESGHVLRVWGNVAVYTYAWQMTYRREGGQTTDSGTDQLVLEQTSAGWQVVWRYMFFQPSSSDREGERDDRE